MDGSRRRLPATGGAVAAGSVTGMPRRVLAAEFTCKSADTLPGAYPMNPRKLS